MIFPTLIKHLYYIYIHYFYVTLPPFLMKACLPIVNNFPLSTFYNTSGTFYDIANTYYIYVYKYIFILHYNYLQGRVYILVGGGQFYNPKMPEKHVHILFNQGKP